VVVRVYEEQWGRLASLYLDHSWQEKNEYFVLLHIIRIVVEEKPCRCQLTKHTFNYDWRTLRDWWVKIILAQHLNIWFLLPAVESQIKWLWRSP